MGDGGWSRMLRRPGVTDKPGKKAEPAKRKGKQNIAFQYSFSVVGTEVNTQDSVETEVLGEELCPVSVVCMKDAETQTLPGELEEITEIYLKLLQKSEKVVSLEVTLNDTMRKLREKEGVVNELVLEKDRLQASLQHLDAHKESIKRSCVSHLTLVETKIEELSLNKAALEQFSGYRKEESERYEKVIETLKMQNQGLRERNEELQGDLQSLQTDAGKLHSELAESNRLREGLHRTLCSHLSGIEDYERRVTELQLALARSKSKGQDLTRELQVKTQHILSLSSSLASLQAQLQLFRRLSPLS